MWFWSKEGQTDASNRNTIFNNLVTTINDNCPEMNSVVNFLPLQRQKGKRVFVWDAEERNTN